MGDVVTVETLNVSELAQAFNEAPALARQYVATELDRGGKRVRKIFAKERLSGPPGIKGGEWKKQLSRHVRVRTEGADLLTLSCTIRLSRFLALHETGGTLVGHHGAGAIRLPIGDRRGVAFRGVRFRRDSTGHLTGLIFVSRAAQGKPPLLAEKVGDELRPKFVLVRSVTIKPRLGFVRTVRQAWPTQYPRIQAALGRAIKVSFERRLTAVSGFVQRVANL